VRPYVSNNENGIGRNRPIDAPDRLWSPSSLNGHRRTLYYEALVALGILYDIHGNVPALEAVLAEADALGVDRWLLGGDYATPSPWPLETLARLRELPSATWIRGNGERWLFELPDDRPDVVEAYEHLLADFPVDEKRWLYALPYQVELEGMLYVHGSPLSDLESFSPAPSEDDERLLANVRHRTVIFGHSHKQFRRPGPKGTELVNPGSVGIPFDGDRRAAWATWDGDFELRRTEYDFERAAAAFRELDDEYWAVVAEHLERASE